MNEFTVHLVSSALMIIFPDNKLANFRNSFNEEINLEGDWRFLLSEIIFPSRTNQINNKILIRLVDTIVIKAVFLPGQFLDIKKVN